MQGNGLYPAAFGYADPSSPLAITESYNMVCDHEIEGFEQELQFFGMRFKRTGLSAIGIVHNNLIGMNLANSLHVAVIEGNQVEFVENIQMSSSLSPLCFVSFNLCFQRANPLMKIVHLCESFGVRMEVHGGGPGNLHVLCAMGIPGEFYERGLLHPFIDYDEVPPWLNSLPDPMDEEGNVHVSDEPGLGWDVNWDYVRDHRVE